jgi:vacuolar-type H+-ATPase subunit I/STV1
VAAPPETHLSDGPAVADAERAALAAKNRRAVAWLGFMVLLGAAWVTVSALLGTITGRYQVDGILGVILGLYVSSFPARHFADLLIYWKIESNRFPTRTSLGWWIALNAVVLLVGWLVIVFAAARFTAGSART